MTPHAWHRKHLQQLLADRARLPHALLVQGRQGIGKVEFARAAAAAVLCESPLESLACGACPSCHWLAQGNHPDYREVVPEVMEEDDAPVDGDGKDGDAKDEKDAKKSLVIKVEQVRANADFIGLSTHRAGYRVLLIHPAESMHPAAANALLKTLEEPPPGTLIILVSNQPARVLATIRSRCRSLALPAPPRDAALAWLKGEGIAPAEAEVALACASGAPLLARDFAQPDESQLRRRVIAELSRPEGADALAYAERIDRPTLDRTVFWMQTWVIDLVSLRASGMLRHHVDSVPAARAKAKAANLDALFDLERELHSARALASHPLNARLMAEHLLMAYNRATIGNRP